jgi:predicted CoA-binding protein
LTLGKEELLQRVFHLSSELDKVEFPLIVKLSTGYDVIPVNPSNELDKKFL